MANQIIENDVPDQEITLNAGDIWKTNTKEGKGYLLVAHNVKHNSWNLINVQTGEFVFDKDIRSISRVIEILKEHFPVRCYSLTLTSNKDE